MKPRPVEAYPLRWPVGWPRSQPAERKRAKFARVGVGYPRLKELSIADGTQRVLAELARMDVERGTIVISTNLRLRNDGLPASDQRQPEDVGVAVYWADPKTPAPRCMAIDIYDRIADNLGAIAASVEALRSIERHGGAQILARAFTGFTALPAPGQGAVRGWREVLGLDPNRAATIDDVEARYRLLRSANHPDRGGSASAFHAVQIAYEQACQELKA